MKVAVSFIKNRFNSERETIKEINKTSADYIHVDIMDGKFVAKKNYNFSDIEKFIKGINLPLDVHLMTENPEKYIKDYALLNTEYITFHYEAVSDVKKVIDLIHSYGIKCGVSIKPKTNIEKLLPYLDDIEQVLVMTVEPGEGGQSFMMEMISKIDYLKKLNKNFIINVDGGINDETIKYVQNADMVVSGSYVCMSDDFELSINKLKKPII